MSVIIMVLVGVIVASVLASAFIYQRQQAQEMTRLQVRQTLHKANEFLDCAEVVHRVEQGNKLCVMLQQHGINYVQRALDLNPDDTTLQRRLAQQHEVLAAWQRQQEKSPERVFTQESELALIIDQLNQTARFLKRLKQQQAIGKPALEAHLTSLRSVRFEVETASFSAMAEMALREGDKSTASMQYKHVRHLIKQSSLDPDEKHQRVRTLSETIRGIYQELGNPPPDSNDASPDDAALLQGEAPLAGAAASAEAPVQHPPTAEGNA